MGIVNGEDFQIVYSDTPGILDPKYKLQESMMSFVRSAMVDADILLLVTDVHETPDKLRIDLNKLQNVDMQVIVLVNKIDLMQQAQVESLFDAWRLALPDASVVAISALHGFNTDILMEKLIEAIPEGPAYFPKDELTDKPMRFFVSEIVREKILLNYQQEIPYSCEVLVESYKDEESIVRIRTLIIVSRDSQKNIIIGSKGSALKKVGTEARKDIESFLDKKVFLELFVKVDKNWRNDATKLKRYGYIER